MFFVSSFVVLFLYVALLSFEDEWIGLISFLFLLFLLCFFVLIDWLYLDFQYFVGEVVGQSFRISWFKRGTRRGEKTERFFNLKNLVLF
jgi:hypothetical protein